MRNFALSQALVTVVPVRYGTVLWPYGHELPNAQYSSHSVARHISSACVFRLGDGGDGRLMVLGKTAVQKYLAWGKAARDFYSRAGMVCLRVNERMSNHAFRLSKSYDMNQSFPVRNLLGTDLVKGTKQTGRL